MLGDKKNKSLILSILFHLCLLILISFGLPNVKQDKIEELVISLENLPISNISNVLEQQEEKKYLNHKEAKSNKEVSNSQKTESPIIENNKQNEEENIEDKKEVEKINKGEEKSKPKEQENIDKIVKPKDEKKVIDEKIKEEDIIKPKENNILNSTKTTEDKKYKEKPKELEKPKTDNKKKQQEEFKELDSLLKTLEAPREKNTDEDVKKNKDDTYSNNKNQKKSQGKYNENLPLSLSERDSIGNQIYNSWYFQAGAKDSKEMQVILKISVNIDGSVVNIEIIDLNRYNKSSSAYRVFVDSAIRAVKKASPFKGLSSERYNAWKELELNFDPRGVIF